VTEEVGIQKGERGELKAATAEWSG